MSGAAVVIGVGNEFRRDDGVGPAVVAALRGRVPTGVILETIDGDPTRLLDVWDGVDLAVVVDAVRCTVPVPGRVHRTGLDRGSDPTRSGGTHGLGLPDAVRLAEVLDRQPRRLVVYAVEAADLDVGPGLSAPVAAAVPQVVAAILDDLRAAASHPVRSSSAPQT